MSKKRVLIGFILAAILLYFFLRNINLLQVWDIIRSGSPYWLLFSVAINIFNYFVRSLRWRYFLLPIKRTGTWNLFSTTVIGFAANTIFPAKIGELVRPYLLGGKEHISRSAALATIVVERLFDTMTVLLMLVIYLLFLIQPDQLSPQAKVVLGELEQAGIVAFAAVIGIVIFLYFLSMKPAPMKKFIRKIERILPDRIAHSLDEVLDSFIQGLSILHDPKILITISYWSIFLWMVIAVGFWAGVRAFIPEFAFQNTFLIMILLAIGVAIPTPGAVGSYHLACKIGLASFFSVPDAQAGAIAIVAHFITFVPVTILGIIFLWQEGLSAKKLTTIAEKAEATLHHHEPESK
jgi:glycosyltransferase 2 family protein